MGGYSNHINFSLAILPSRTSNPATRALASRSRRVGYNDMVEMDKDWDPCVDRAKLVYRPFCIELDMLGRA